MTLMLLYILPHVSWFYFTCASVSSAEVLKKKKNVIPFVSHTGPALAAGCTVVVKVDKKYMFAFVIIILNCQKIDSKG